MAIGQNEKTYPKSFFSGEFKESSAEELRKMSTKLFHLTKEVSKIENKIRCHYMIQNSKGQKKNEVADDNNPSPDKDSRGRYET